MNWLTAALAFAITMLLFTSMVSAIVESIQRVFGLRRRGLQWMLRAMYEEIATRRPDLVSQLGQAQGVLDTPFEKIGPIKNLSQWLQEKLGVAPPGQTTSQFLESMTRNFRASEFHLWLPHFLRPQHVHSLTPVEFAQRLARTDIGAAFAKKAETEWQHLLNGVLERFDFYGQAAAETFGQRAKAMSIIVSFVFAFALNVNAVALFYSFANRPQLAEAMVAQQEEIQRRYEEAQRRAANLAAAGTSSDAEEKQIQEDIRDRLDELKTQFGSLVKLGLPIGWSATRCASNADDEFCSVLTEVPQWQCAEDCGLLDVCSASAAYGLAWLYFPFGHTRWLVSTLLAGLLIGFGGPFWYNVCSNLSRTARLARAVGDGVKGAPPTDGSQASPRPGEASLLSTPARAFAAAIILDTDTPPLVRALLNPNGVRDTGGRL
jgi:hypothetical protein